MTDLSVLAVALAVDLALGEYPAAVHPVVWMGRVIALLEKSTLSGGRLRQLAFGAGIAIAVPLAFTIPTWLVFHGLVGVSNLTYVLAGGLLLKATFAIRALQEAVEGVRAPLAAGRLVEARAGLRNLVSRDTSNLDEGLVAAAAVESAAENASDSFVAPIFYFVLFGLPGAVAYRAINTLDAMIGYHGKYEYLGKAAARLDDLANLIPSRLTALLIVAAARMTGADSGRAWRTAWRYSGATESPNAGWPMSAMAGALRSQLEKAGHYRLGEPLEPLSPAKLAHGMRVVKAALALAVVLAAFALGAVEVLRGART